jgi:hypothetical protein
MPGSGFTILGGDRVLAYARWARLALELVLRRALIRWFSNLSAWSLSVKPRQRSHRHHGCPSSPQKKYRPVVGFRLRANFRAFSAAMSRAVVE